MTEFEKKLLERIDNLTFEIKMLSHSIDETSRSLDSLEIKGIDEIKDALNNILKTAST